MGFRLLDRAKVFVRQIDADDREHDGQSGVGTTNSKAIILQVIANPRFDLPPSTKCHLPLSSGKREAAWLGSERLKLEDDPMRRQLGIRFR